jgi:hypothetical protein
LDDLVPSVRHLSDDKFLVTGSVRYHRDCGAGLIAHECPAQCMVIVGGSCTLNTSNEFVSKVHGNSAVFSQKFTVVASMMSHLYNMDEIKLFVKGDTTYDEMPDTETLPLNFYERKDKFFADDSKISMDLGVALKQMKERSMIVQSLADSIVLGSQPINLDNLWDSTLGYACIACFILVGLLALQVVYLSLRLKMTLAMLAVIKSGIEVNGQMISESVVSPKFRLSRIGFDDVSPLPALGPNEIHIKIVQALSNSWTLLLLGLVVLGITMIILRFWLRSYCREMRQSRVQTWIALQMSVVGGNKNGLILKIQRVGINAVDIGIVSNDFPSNFQLGGCLGNELTFSYDAEIFNEFTNEKFPLKNSVTLKLYQAYLTKNFMRSRFYCQIVLCDGEKILKPRFRQGVLSEAPSLVSVRKKQYNSTKIQPEATVQIEMKEIA